MTKARDMIEVPQAQYVYNRNIGALLDAPVNPIRAAVYVETDPPSGIALFSVYEDDGHGNGRCLLSLPLSELVKLGAKLGALG